MINRISELTNEQKQYIIDNYKNSQTWKISDDLDVNIEVVRDFAEKCKLKKDKDFIVIRKNSKLTLEQCEFIIKNYNTMTNDEIIDRLKISYKDLRSFSSRRRLIKNKNVNKSIKYTDYQKKIVKENYSFKSNKEISDILGIEEKDVIYLARKMKLLKDKDYVVYKDGKLSYEQKIFIKNNYDKMKTNDICKKLNLSYNAVKGYASNLKLKKTVESSNSYNNYFKECLLKRKNKEGYNVYSLLNRKEEPKVKCDNLYKSKYGKYKVNDKYFDKIDNEWKAYWLGFLYADGANIINRDKKKKDFLLKLGLNYNDRDHIEKFKESIQSDSVIKDRFSNLNGKKYKNSSISVCNKNICEHLEILGCVPNKSLILKFPNENQVPKKLIRHFIRGYFDGDGCIHINLDKKNTILNFLGTYDFLYKLEKELKNELNLREKNINKLKDRRIYSLSYGSVYEIEKIYKYLYTDCNIYLDRKLKKFDILLCLD